MYMYIVYPIIMCATKPNRENLRILNSDLLQLFSDSVPEVQLAVLGVAVPVQGGCLRGGAGGDTVVALVAGHLCVYAPSHH